MEKLTENQKLLNRIIKMQHGLLQDARTDVETGIEEGIYENTKQNKNWLKKLDRADMDLQKIKTLNLKI